MASNSRAAVAMDQVSVSLRQAIRAIVLEVVGDPKIDLKQLVREAVIEELSGLHKAVPVDQAAKRSAAANKAVATRRAHEAMGIKPATKSPPKPSPTSFAKNALKMHGVAAGQQYKAKAHIMKIAGRVIEVIRVDATGIWPRIISAAHVKKSLKAKHIKFDSLAKLYDRKS